MSKILIIEDDAMMQDIYKSALTSEGFEVITASDGEDGLQKAITEIPDLILLDIFLPKLSGFEIVEKVKNNPDLVSIAIIVLTNIFVNKEDLLEKGVRRCYIKSELTPGSLISKIREVLQNPQN